jgi:predicted dehydrogenase
MLAEGNYSHDWLAACPSDHWRSNPKETRSGGMTGMGVHLLDCFTYLVGDVRRVSAVATERVLELLTGDTTSALIEFTNGATGTLNTTLKSPYIWRVAIYGSDASAESISETRLIVRRCGREPELIDLSPANHIRANLESFAAAALGRGSFHISNEAIVHTVAALEAVFRSAESRGAWESVPHMGFERKVA